MEHLGWTCHPINPMLGSTLLSNRDPRQEPQLQLNQGGFAQVVVRVGLGHRPSPEPIEDGSTDSIYRRPIFKICRAIFEGIAMEFSHQMDSAIEIRRIRLLSWKKPSMPTSDSSINTNFKISELGNLPSGKLTFCYGKSPFLMGKLTINGHFQ